MPFVIAAFAALVITPLAALVATRVGLVDRPGSLKIHERPVPLAGGAAIVGALLVAMATTSGAARIWVAGAIVLAAGVGFADDRRSIEPGVRLAVEALAGVLLVAGGLRLGALGGIGALGLVAATVCLCNAVNMLDGQDGLVAGLVVAAGLGIAGIAVVDAAAALPLALAGAATGFLVWNRPPASVFLGDAGAYAIGVALAASAATASAGSLSRLAGVSICLGVFAVEFVTTVVRRVRARTPAVDGDREHTNDRLASRLGSRGRSTWVMWLIGVGAALVGSAVATMPAAGAAALAIALLLSVCAVVSFGPAPSTSTPRRIRHEP